MHATGVAFPRMAGSRKTAWLRDELVLALDLYFREGRRPALESRRALSETLRSFPEEAELAVASAFRDLRSVDDRLRVFALIDRDYAADGRSGTGSTERAVWDEFVNDRGRLRSETNAIREGLTAGSRYDVAAFLKARIEPLEDPYSGARFRVVDCTPDTVTYRRPRARDTSSRTVATSTLQEILNEVVDRAHGHRTFFVEVAPQFDLDHGKFANAVMASIAGHVFGWYNGFGEDVDLFGEDVDSAAGSDSDSETRSLRGVRGMENRVARQRSADVGVAYVPVDESAAVAERDPFVTDPDVVERGTRSHARLQNLLAAEVLSAGLVPLSPAADDPPSTLRGGMRQTSMSLRSRARPRRTRSISCVWGSGNCSATGTRCPPTAPPFTRRSMLNGSQPTRSGPSSVSR